MKSKGLALAVGVLLAQSLAAQTATMAGDAITGTWTGFMARDTDRVPITVTLKWESNSITGKVEGPPRLGIVKSGTFDKASGAMKFEVEVQDDRKTNVTFDGKLMNDKASGNVLMNGQTGTFSLTRGTAAATMPEPQAGGMPPNEALQKEFATVSGYVTKSAEMIPAEKYSYQPVKTVRTVGQLIAHIADGYNYFCANGSGKKVEWSDAVEKGATDKATVTAKLKQATDACTAAYAAGGAPPLIENYGHTNLHYGNLITYLRMLGLVPPSS